MVGYYATGDKQSKLYYFIYETRKLTKSTLSLTSTRLYNITQYDNLNIQSRI